MARLRLFLILAAVGLLGVSWGPAAAAQARLNMVVDSLRPGGVILGAYAYCVTAKRNHDTTGPNRSPEIAWSRGPSGTRSYALVVVDTDVPTVFTNANKEGRVIPAGMKRRPYYHWVLVDIPPSMIKLPEDAGSKDAAPKPAGPSKYGVEGLNDYGDGRGAYDGPCPPWNDAIVHHYHFQVYALNVAHLSLPAGFTGPDVVKAIQGHMLARGEIVGLYTLNPVVAKTLRR
ncbi:MAG TPA: YbhB/YbcL family Raf kinase inhibitor-like protein [bacterium]|nr:YbhB/YbcL family Raf kinase inhibitor-like protein [bacterium]